MHHALFALALAALAAVIAAGAVRFYRAARAYRVARAFADYRAASMVITERDKLRAAQHRANEREWGRP